MQVAYLGPAGTFSEDALRAAAGGRAVRAAARATIYDAIIAVDDGEAERALVPFENSIEGSVRATLDALAFDAPAVTIVGEHDQPISHSLIARGELELSEIELGRLPSAGERPVRPLHPRGAARRRGPRGARAPPRRCARCAERDEPWAALGTPSAAAIYGCVVLREGVEDDDDNVTRFVWLAPDGTRARGRRGRGRRRCASPSSAPTIPARWSRR